MRLLGVASLMGMIVCFGHRFGRTTGFLYVIGFT
jgi:hypothetical protein